MSTGIDYPELIKKVLADDLALNYFHEQWERNAHTAFDSCPRAPLSLRVSDSGSCSLSLWADLHGKYTIPDEVGSVDSRMQPGILDGMRTACLIAAGISRWYWPLSTILEPSVDCNGIAGHADVLVCAEPDVLEVIECKMTFFTKPIEPPEERHKYWIHQACMYALGMEAPHFVVLVNAPAVWGGNPTRRAFRYLTADFEAETLREYARLGRALLKEPPEADPDFDWRCKSCRYAGCELNANPLLPRVETVADEVGVI